MTLLGALMSGYPNYSNSQKNKLPALSTDIEPWFYADKILPCSVEIPLTWRVDWTGQGWPCRLWDRNGPGHNQVIIHLFFQKYCEKESLEKKEIHSKLDNLFYSSLSTQDYLTNKDLSAKQAQLVFAHRVRMANYREHFRGYSGHTPCPLCLYHLDSQPMCMSCPITKENVSIQGQYQHIFSNKIMKKWLMLSCQGLWSRQFSLKPSLAKMAQTVIFWSWAEPKSSICYCSSRAILRLKIQKL